MASRQLASFSLTEASAASSSLDSAAMLARWLWIVSALVVAIVVVGGITRLTESGLSITEWKPVTGIVPPLSEAAWRAEFALYRATPEYRQINAGMTIEAFKSIYFWEYIHRLLGRVIGLAFALPFAWFALRRRIPAGYPPRLFALLALIGLQGAIGWWMVTSGLAVRTDVSHVRLAVHLVTALTILGGLVWTARDLAGLARGRERRPARLTPLAASALAALTIQITFGAFTAGLNAGHAFASWPLMGDALFPADAPMLSPALRNLIDNPLVVQFTHRWLAFAVAALLLVLGLRAARAGAPRLFGLLACLVVLQIALGIATLLTGVALHVAVAHQAIAALLVIAATLAAHRIGSARPA